MTSSPPTKLSIAVKRHHEHGNSYNRKHLIKMAAHNFRGFVCHHLGRHGLLPWTWSS
ncbi:hypothetical protein LEMLEM_LOCUS11797 [Lemmus lemmus]